MAVKFSVRACPGKRSFSASIASESPLVLKVDVPEEPEKGRANRMLLSALENMLGCDVTIVAGHTGRKKTLVADCSQGQLLEQVKKNGKNTEKPR
ncbi:putative ACR, YggU family [uncultured archaeon]|nr:putative ACR, YggU family [uncultured archaeon]